jgi:hypothetical protein
VSPPAHAFGAFDEQTSYATPERRLMLAVIANAVAEAIGKATDIRLRDKLRAEAFAWFWDAGPDFQDVCHLAGLDPAATRRAVLDFVASEKPMPRNNPAIRDPRRNRRTSPFGVPLTTIADHAGVSPSSAAKVLKGVGNPNPEIKLRVRNALRELSSQAPTA